MNLPDIQVIIENPPSPEHKEMKIKELEQILSAELWKTEKEPQALDL